MIQELTVLHFQETLVALLVYLVIMTMPNALPGAAVAMGINCIFVRDFNAPEEPVDGLMLLSRYRMKYDADTLVYVFEKTRPAQSCS